MKEILKNILTVIAVILVVLGVSSIESSPIILPLLMIIGGGAWIVYIANSYKWDV